MARYNRQELLRSLQQYRQQIEEITNLIEQENWPRLEQHFQSTHSARAKFVPD